MCYALQKISLSFNRTDINTAKQLAMASEKPEIKSANTDWLETSEDYARSGRIAKATDGRERSRDKSRVPFAGSRHNKAPISGALIMFGAEGGT